MNTVATLLVLTVIALTAAAALYSNFRLGIDRNAVYGSVDQVSWLLEDRHSIIEAIKDIADHAEATPGHDELKDLGLTLAKARRALTEFSSKDLSPDITAQVSTVENAVVDSLKALLLELDSDTAITNDVSYGNRRRQLHRRSANLEEAVDAYNIQARVYQQRMGLPWVRPFASLFGHDSVGELDIATEATLFTEPVSSP